MAKKAKGNRVQVILECTEQKASGVPGISRYITTKNKKNTPERIERKKYNPYLQGCIYFLLGGWMTFVGSITLTLFYPQRQCPN